MSARVPSFTLATLAIVVLAACSGRDVEYVDEPTASLTLALPGGDVTGASVRICGSRPPPDAKYRCDSELSAAPFGGSADDCPCFDFHPAGFPIDPLTSLPLVLSGLCASSASPAADWTFEYFLYDAPNCGGPVINTPLADFLCYDSQDLNSREHPNTSTETLVAGNNTNHVLCVVTPTQP